MTATLTPIAKELRKEERAQHRKDDRERQRELQTDGAVVDTMTKYHCSSCGWWGWTKRGLATHERNHENWLTVPEATALMAAAGTTLTPFVPGPYSDQAPACLATSSTGNVELFRFGINAMKDHLWVTFAWRQYFRKRAAKAAK